MPYRSEKQRAFMHINRPDIAKRWDKKYGGKIVPSKKKGNAAGHEGGLVHHEVHDCHGGLKHEYGSTVNMGPGCKY